MLGYTVKRIIKLNIGVMIASLGVYLTIQANIGLSAWEALTVGMASQLGISIGTATIGVSVLTLLLAVLMKEKVGIGAISNAVAVGLWLDLFIALRLCPLVENPWLGILVLIGGLFVLSIGMYYYIISEYGGGPRDALTIAASKRFSKLPFGFVRAALDLIALLLGWLLRKNRYRHHHSGSFARNHHSAGVSLLSAQYCDGQK